MQDMARWSLRKVDTRAKGLPQTWMMQGAPVVSFSGNAGVEGGGETQMKAPLESRELGIEKVCSRCLAREIEGIDQGTEILGPTAKG